MLSGMDTGTERLSVLGGGPNIFARFIAICLLHSLYHIIHNRRYLFGSILPFLLGSLVISGSRGVIVATMLMILLLFYIKKIFSLRSIIRSTFLFLFLFLGGYVILAIGIPKTFEVVQNSIEQRFYQKTLVQGSSSGRDDIWQRAYTHSWEHPFLGHGLASWKYYYEEESYPHNIFLELFYEGGLASVGIFLVMIFLTCKSCAINARNKRLRCYYICLLTMFFFASLFSGDIFDSRCVFSMMLIVSIPEKD
jgi:O-antigen ligase